MNDDTTPGAPPRGGNDDETGQMPTVPRSPWESPAGTRAADAESLGGQRAPSTGPNGPAGPPPPPGGHAAEGHPQVAPGAPQQAPPAPAAASGPERETFGSHAAGYGAPESRPYPAYPTAPAWQQQPGQAAGPWYQSQATGQPEPQPAWAHQQGGWQSPGQGWQQPGAALPPTWTGQHGRPPAGRPGFLRALFDLSFRHSVTVGFAKVIYVLAIVVAVGAWVIALFTSLSAMNDPWVGAAAGWGVVGTLVLGLPLVLLWIVLVRVGLEVTVATVRTADNTARLVELGEDRADR